LKNNRSKNEWGVGKEVPMNRPKNNELEKGGRNTLAAPEYEINVFVFPTKSIKM
jgi:hypothetical protein